MSKLSLGRRQFFKKSALGALGAGLAARSSSASGAGPVSRSGSQEAPDDRPRIKEYRMLGRTGFKVSDISCGNIPDEGVIQAAYESGMNYFDTAKGPAGRSRSSNSNTSTA